jgi:protoporphyrin/coproporphyrin ferrochelatase
MASYLGLSNHTHGATQRTGVLVANLGTPDAPDTASVRRYLKQFLSDPRVIEYPRWLWWLILNGIILNVRPRKSAHAYQQIWTPQGSPLLVHTRSLANKLQQSLQTTLGGELPVAVGMSYGNPSIADALQHLQQAGVTRLLVLPLYPQYSGSTTGSVFDAVTKALQGWRWVPELRFINAYHDDADHIAALAQSIRQHWQQHGQHHLVMSFHGLPKRYLLNGDPYFCHCHKTARLVAEALHLQQHEWPVTFQSRVGREEWLRPYTDETLKQLPAQGIKRITVACPAFAVDCLETLEEIALRNREDFLAAGGEAFDYVPALNDSDAQVHALTRLVSRHLQGWPLHSESPQAAALATAKGAAR